MSVIADKKGGGGAFVVRSAAQAAVKTFDAAAVKTSDAAAAFLGSPPNYSPSPAALELQVDPPLFQTTFPRTTP